MLAGKVVAVTGGGRGIGREIAIACAREGAAVVINDPGVGQDGEGGDSGPASRVCAEIAQAGGKAVANTASVADPAGAATIIDDAIDHFDRIDAVMACAGILRDAIWHKLSPEAWRAVIDVHLNGAFHVAKAATPHFREQQAGSFVFFTSASGLVGNIGQANYAAAKLGVVGLAQSIALDMARYGVRANCIAPVAFTRMIASLSGDTSGEDPQGHGREGMDAARIAPLAVYLASDASRDVTNQIFGVQGDAISMFSKPRPLRTLGRRGGWSAQAIADDLIPALRDVMPRADELAADAINGEPDWLPPGDNRV